MATTAGASIRTAIERLTFGHMEDNPRVIHAASRPTTILVGRIFLAAIFVLSGVMKLVDPSGAIGHMSSQGIPYAHVLLYFAALAEVVGGLWLMFGFLTRIAALGLAIYLIPVTLIFHAFWAVPPEQVAMQSANFMKNLAIIGGMLLMMAVGGGPYSLDAKLRRRI